MKIKYVKLKFGGMICIPINVKVKAKVKLSLYFIVTDHLAMNAYWGSGSIANRILYLGTRWT
jgi:hypothetical protein